MRTIRVVDPLLDDDGSDSVHADDGVLVGIGDSLHEGILEERSVGGLLRLR